MGRGGRGRGGAGGSSAHSVQGKGPSEVALDHDAPRVVPVSGTLADTSVDAEMTDSGNAVVAAHGGVQPVTGDIAGVQLAVADAALVTVSDNDPFMSDANTETATAAPGGAATASRDGSTAPPRSSHHSETEEGARGTGHRVGSE